MVERLYTVAEVNALRWAVESKLRYGLYDPFAHGEKEIWSTRTVKTSDVEEIMRTHMLAGHTATDLAASEGAA